MHTPYRFIDGLAEDMVGYIFPCGNGVGVPGEYPVSNPSADSADRFGCGHSDDSESASSDAGNVIGRPMRHANGGRMPRFGVGCEVFFTARPKTHAARLLPRAPPRASFACESM